MGVIVTTLVNRDRLSRSRRLPDEILEDARKESIAFDVLFLSVEEASFLFLPYIKRNGSSD